MVRMVVTDLDGTLLGSYSQFSDRNMDALRRLGQRGVVRVIATGRSPYSADLVIPADFPIDYLIFSSGAGIIEWSSKSLVHSDALPVAKVQEVIDFLVECDVNFMVHEPIPQNHCFLYHRANIGNPDFERRVELYHDFCNPLILGVPYPNNATQLLAVLPPHSNIFLDLKQRLSGVNVIRATSPLDGESIWMEIFPEGISKGHSVDWLCRALDGIKPNEVAAIGNDYNDLDMLAYTPNSFVVRNAPADLRERFRVVKSNDNDGFAEAVGLILEID